MKPFLKWAGNKYAVRYYILPMLGSGKRYFEPFLGSGAIFANLEGFDTYWLADTNRDLINLYACIRDKLPALLNVCENGLFHTACNQQESFTQIRERYNTTRSQDVITAARLLYLNRHCFNGLYRVNKSGGFNVPFGRYDKPYFPKEELIAWSLLLHKKTIALGSEDFEITMAVAGEGDVVYCDPPYFPESNTSNFKSYSAQGWRPIEDTLRLIIASKQARERGVVVVHSNSNTPFVREMFGKAGAHIYEIPVNRRIAAKASCRGMKTELIIKFGDKP